MEALYDVIIVGAGISGLYTAYHLEKHGLKVLVLEGRGRIGGRQYTKWDDEIDYVDLGGAYIGKQQQKILQVMEELGLETYHPLDYQLESILYDQGKRLRYQTGTIDISGLSPFVLMDLNNAFQTIDKLSKQVDPEAPWATPMAHYWDNISMGEFVDKTCWMRFTKMLLANAIRLVFGAEMENVSFLYVLKEVHATGGFTALTATKNGLQEYKVRGGSGSISKKLAERLKGTIRLKTGVTKIVQDADCVRVCDEQDNVFKAKRVAVCTGLTMLSVLQFEPPLPKYVTEMTDFRKIKVHDYGFKTIVYYKSRFWHDKGLSGEMLSSEGLVTYCLDDTKADGSHPAIMGFITADKNIEGAKGTPERRMKMICEQYAAQFGLEEFLHPINYREKHWQDEEEMHWGRGICVFSLPPGVLTKHKRYPGEPHGLVHFSSTEMAHTMPGYMDGALRCAQKTATQILREFGKEVEDDPLCSNFQDIPYLPSALVEKLLPSIPQFVMIVGVTSVALAAMVLNHLW